MSERRTLSFTNVSDADIDVRRLRVGCQSAGEWSLPQVCYHLNAGMESSLKEPTTLEFTDEQKKRRGFFDNVVAHGWPNQQLPSPDFLSPPANAAPSSIDDLLATFQKIENYKSSNVDSKAFGPVEKDQMVRFFLAHAERHLSFLKPTIEPPSRRAALRFTDTDSVIADVEPLGGGYLQAKNWTLPQICGHIAAIIEMSLVPAPADAVATPEQLAGQHKFSSTIMSGGSGTMSAPPHSVPPAESGDDQINRLLTALEKLKTFPHERILVGKLGPESIEKIRQLHLVHAAHHLSFLVPTHAEREGLAFPDVDAVIGDVDRLRKNDARIFGSWTLPQTCWHLATVMKKRMTDIPVPSTPEQIARRPVLESVLKSRTLPKGLPAPTEVVPPPDAGDDSIDNLISTLKTFAAYAGPIGSHPIFGELSADEAKKLNLIHCAHHLKRLAVV